MIFQAALWFFALGASLMFSSSFEAESFACVVFLISLCLTVSVGRALQVKGLRMPHGSLLKIGVAFWALALISVLLSETRFESFLYFWFFLCLPFSFLIFSTVPAPEKFFRVGAIGFGIIAVFLSIAALVQFIFVRDMLVYDMVMWPLVNPNSLAALLSLGLFGALGVMLGSDNRLHSNAALLLSLLMVAALLVSGSRAAFFGLAPALAFFIFLNFALVKKHRRCMVWFFLGAGSIFIVAAFGGAALPDKLASLAIAPGLKSMDVRFAIWASTWEMIRDHFWTGTGIGTFFLYYPEYRGRDFISAGLMAHNDPLQFWAEMGIAAPLLFYTFIGLAIRRTVKALKALAPGDLNRIIITAPFCALMALILHTHASFHFYVLPLLLSIGFFLALWFWATAKALNEQEHIVAAPKGWSAPTTWTVCFVPFVLMMSIFFAAAGSEILLRRAQEASVAGDMQRFAADVNAASKLSHNMNAKAFIVAASVPIGILQEMQGNLDVQGEDNLYKQASGLLVRASSLNPRLADIPYQRAVLAQLTHKNGSIEDFLLHALRLNPLHAPARRMLASHYQNAGRKDEALKILKDGMNWPYREEDAMEFYQRAARTFLENGDVEAHLVAMKKMQAVLQK